MKNIEREQDHLDVAIAFAKLELLELAMGNRTPQDCTGIASIYKIGQDRVRRIDHGSECECFECWNDQQEED